MKLRDWVCIWIVTLCFLSIACNSVDTGILENNETRNMSDVKKKIEIDYSDPCWDLKPGALEAASSEMLKKRRIRNDNRLFGFAEDTPLGEAVRLLNEEMSCYPYLREFPPLTEEEVIAAIAVDAMGRDAFWKIATSRIVSKGTVLSAHGGGNMVGTPLSPDGRVSPKGIEIYMRLDADKNGREGQATPPRLEEMLTIRKVFTNIVISK